MTDRYQNAVTWLEPICRDLVTDNKIQLPERSFLEVYLSLTLGIAPSNGFYQIPDGKASVLYDLASEQAGAYDLVCTICATNLSHNRPLPECLRLFLAQVVTGKRK